jgi:UDP-glucose 6-dehydrogenase
LGTEISKKRQQMNGIIKNVENNLDIAIELFYKTNEPSYQFQIDHYSNELKSLRDEVWNHEQQELGANIRTELKLLSVGWGFVGSAIGEHIKPHIKEHIIIDPAHSSETIQDHPDANAAIVCVPTPTVDNVCDDSIIQSVIAELIATNPKIKILLKSTVPPDQLQHYPENVTYNPEFLRAKTAKEDFKNQKTFILGGLDRRYWHMVFSYMDVEFLKTDRTTASMVKYMHNTWLAMKVAYFHEVYSLMGDYYDHHDMIRILSTFENIGPSHMQAPNDEGSLGFSGHCFPKDVEAFHNFTGSDILKKIIDVNHNLKQYK